MTPPDRRPAVRVGRASGTRTVALESLLDPDAADRAEADANRWIKSLRHARIESATVRDRFTHRGDSLWWFAEIYLHKTRAVASAFATLGALDALAADERPRRLTLLGANGSVHDAAAAFCAARGIPFEAAAPRRDDLRWQGRAYMSAAALRHLRRRPPAVPPRVDVASFVHSAFWRDETSDEAYVGPVLRAIADRVTADRHVLIGLGPRTNFRARGWRSRVRELREPFGITPVERFATWRAIAPARAVWAGRARISRALEASPDLRERSVVHGCDLWPLVRRELAGLAYLQFPWSALAMDEAGAALDALRPAAAFTYAEAGGWGRALALESRRRHIPLIALQHGFIYRHWLNYQHEDDEMQASPFNDGDAGYPIPALTLLHDEVAGRHLRETARVPSSALRVVGSVRLDALVRSARALDADGRARMRGRVGAGPSDALIVVASKFTQIGHVFADLVAAVRDLARVRLVVKCHPAEAPDPYERASTGAANVAIAPADTDLGQLIGMSRLLVTVNSTAAIEAMVLGVPSLVVARPSNLGPFVDAGVMAGAGTPDEIREGVHALLYDEERRAALARRRTAFLQTNRIDSDGRAAERAAAAILEFVNRSGSARRQ